jgi:hypothetical protein
MGCGGILAGFPRAVVTTAAVLTSAYSSHSPAPSRAARVSSYPNAMKQFALLAAALVLSGSIAALAGPADDVKAAAKKLSEKGSYSWKATTESAGFGGGGGRFRSPTEGKVGKDGLVHLKMTFGENVTEAFRRGESVAIKSQSGAWRTPDELSDGGGGPGRGAFAGRMIQNTALPAEQAAELAGKVKDLKEADGVYSGDLTEEGAKSLMRFGARGGGGGGPEVRNAKGTVKFWIKDGVLSKYEYKVQGAMAGRDGNEREIDRTTTVEISDVGATTVTAPEEAKKKLS